MAGLIDEKAPAAWTLHRGSAREGLAKGGLQITFFLCAGGYPPGGCVFSNHHANEPSHHLITVSLALATMAASSSSVMSMARLKTWVSEVLNVGALP